MEMIKFAQILGSSVMAVILTEVVKYFFDDRIVNKQKYCETLQQQHEINLARLQRNANKPNQTFTNAYSTNLEDIGRTQREIKKLKLYRLLSFIGAFLVAVGVFMLLCFFFTENSTQN